MGAQVVSLVDRLKARAVTVAALVVNCCATCGGEGLTEDDAGLVIECQDCDGEGKRA